MTGLLLVVPPKQKGGDVNVLLPNPKSLGEHVAWLGFGFESLTSDQRRLCESDPVFINAGICYVNLDTWTLERFGTGGNPTSDSSIVRPGIVNVTSLAGGQHKVHISSLKDDLRTKVVFRAGAPGETCILGNWEYEEGGKTERKPVANVLEWKIDNLSDRRLVFSGQGTTIPVSLPATGDVHLLLAHVPRGEVRDLPPRVPGAVSNAVVSSAPHFGAYYELLRSQGTNPEPLPPGDPRRKPLVNGKPITTQACRVKVTGNRKLLADKPWAIGTIACMVATADPH